MRSGASVDISGFPAGKVSSIELDRTGVLVKFSVDKTIFLGDRTEAAIKTKSLLGSKVLDVAAGNGNVTLAAARRCKVIVG